MKDLKPGLFAERCSSNLFDANTLRLYLSAFAHVLHNRMAAAVAGARLSKASPETFRLRLLKIGARVRVSVRRIHVAMSSSCPDKEAFIAGARNWTRSADAKESLDTGVRLVLALVRGLGRDTD